LFELRTDTQQPRQPIETMDGGAGRRKPGNSPAAAGLAR